MKKTRIGALLLAMVLMISVMVSTTTAHAVRLVEEARIYVDGERVKVDAFIDSNEDIRVYEVEELYKILPKLEKEVYVLPNNDGYVVIDYLEYVDYGYMQDGERLYIYTDEHYSEGEVIDIGDLTEEKPCELYVNGLYVKTDNAYVNAHGEVFLVGFEDVFKIFSKETANMYLPFNSTQETYLLDWCNRFDYKMTRIRDHVFINNNGQTPVEIRVNGCRVEFPDQQPVIVPPGRTMIPIASVAEVTGCSVTWDGQYQRVIIEKGNNKLILWIGDETYWFNGYYYEMDVKPYILNNRTMVPIAFISQVFQQTLTTHWEDGVFVIDLSSGW